MVALGSSMHINGHRAGCSDNATVIILHGHGCSMEFIVFVSLMDDGGRVMPETSLRFQVQLFVLARVCPWDSGE